MKKIYHLYREKTKLQLCINIIFDTKRTISSFLKISGINIKTELPLAQTNKIPFLPVSYNFLYSFRLCPSLSSFWCWNNQSFYFRTKLFLFLLINKTTSHYLAYKVVPLGCWNQAGPCRALPCPLPLVCKIAAVSQASPEPPKNRFKQLLIRTTAVTESLVPPEGHK